MIGQEKHDVELLKNWLLSLRKFSRTHEDWVILVEGKRDKMVLERFGIENVKQLKSKPYHTIADEISKKYKGVVLLMDFDKKGEQISKKLFRILQMYGMKIDTSFREKLRKSKLEFIEEISDKLKMKRKSYD